MDDRAPDGLLTRLAWFLGIWLAGATVLGVIAALLRWMP